MTNLQLCNFLRIMRGTGPVNVAAIAMILTESKFRPFYFRLAEVLLAVFQLYVLKREPTLTLGKCQVSYNYWRRRFGKNNINLLRATFRSADCYQISCDFLAGQQASNQRETLVQYNGRPSHLYVQTYQENWQRIHFVATHARIILA